MKKNYIPLLFILGFSFTASHSMMNMIKTMRMTSIPKESFKENFDPYSALYYFAILDPTALKFLYRQGLITEEHLNLLFYQPESTGSKLAKKIMTMGKTANIESRIDAAFKNIPYIKGLKKYYGDSVITQAALGGAGLAGLTGLHYYHKWPVYKMQELEKKYRDSNGTLEIQPTTLTKIKNSIAFWQKVLGEIGKKVALDDTWETLKAILANEKNLIPLLLHTAVERLNLMHGKWKYLPTGWYRKAQEMGGDIWHSSKSSIRKPLATTQSFMNLLQKTSNKFSFEKP